MRYGSKLKSIKVNTGGNSRSQMSNWCHFGIKLAIHTWSQNLLTFNLCIQQTRKKRILTLTYLMGVNAYKNNHCLCFEPQFILISAYYWLLKNGTQKILNAVH
jgi:hypothetical protein